MSFEPDDTDDNITLINQNQEMITLLKGILMAVEMIADQEEGSLLEDINED